MRTDRQTDDMQSQDRASNYSASRGKKLAPESIYTNKPTQSNQTLFLFSSVKPTPFESYAAVFLAT